jgi:SPP1 gp7 family putative phage head morphogenesis protein
MANQQFEQNVAFANDTTLKRAAKKGKLPKRITKPSRWLYPLNIERKLQAQYSNAVKDFNDRIKQALSPLLPRIFDIAELEKRTDDEIDDLNTSLEELALLSAASLSFIKDTAATAGSSIADLNETQFVKLIKGSLAVDVITDDPWLQNEIRLFAAQNASLIKSVQDKSLTDIEGIIQRGVQQGSPLREVEKEIQKKLKNSRKKAKFIARDQTNKLNGAITKTRQQSLGIDMYIWRTSDDERVRPNHKAMDDKLCRWDDASVYSKDGGKTWLSRSSIGGVQLHPGADYNCRCYGEPSFEGFVNQIA